MHVTTSIKAVIALLVFNYKAIYYIGSSGFGILLHKVKFDNSRWRLNSATVGFAEKSGIVDAYS